MTQGRSTVNGDIDAAGADRGASSLAEVGYEGVTMDATAARAGTSKAAIYRRFSSKAELLFAAMLHAPDIEPPDDTGTLYGDLVALANRDQDPAEQPRSPCGRLQHHRRDQPLARGRARLRATSTTAERAVIAAILERAVDRRELAGMPSAETVHRLIGGGLIATALAFGEHLDDDALTEMVAIVAAGLTTASQSASTSRHGSTAIDTAGGARSLAAFADRQVDGASA